MITVTFRKEQANYFLECLRTGKAIQPVGEWTGDDLICLAGTCASLAWNQVPKEFGDQYGDLDAAIQFVRHLVDDVQLGRYDDSYEPYYRAQVKAERRGIFVHPIEGVRRQPELPPRFKIFGTDL